MDVIFENLLMFYNNFVRNTMAVIKLSCFVCYNKRLETISLAGYIYVCVEMVVQ